MRLEEGISGFALASREAFEPQKENRLRPQAALSLAAHTYIIVLAEVIFSVNKRAQAILFGALRLCELEHDFSEVLTGLHDPMGRGSLGCGQHFVNRRAQTTCFERRSEACKERSDYLGLLGLGAAAQG